MGTKKKERSGGAGTLEHLPLPRRQTFEILYFSTHFKLKRTTKIPCLVQPRLQLPLPVSAPPFRLVGPSDSRHSWRVYISARVDAGGGSEQNRRAQLGRGEHGFECRLLILYTELYCAVCAFLANYIEYFMNEEIDKYKTCNYYVKK